MRVGVIRYVYAVALLFVALVAVQPSWAGETLFTAQTPAETNFSNGPNYELGTAFTSNIAGQITAVRFWKAPSEGGTHIGNVWSSTGQLLASVTFANETASGWQQQALANPLTIAPNTIYVVSVNTGATYFVYTPGGLSSQVSNENLTSVGGNNGLAGNPGVFPTIITGNNFFRDIVFVPAGAPLQSGNNCNGTYSGAFNGNVTVTNGQSCVLVNGVITGNITLSGGSLAISDFAVVGNVQVQGGAFSIGPSAVIGGNLQIDPQSPPPPPPPPGPPAPPAPPGPPGPVQNVPGATGQGQICGATVRGNVQFQNDGAPVLIGSASPASCAGNYIGGNLTIQNNSGSVSVIGNAISGNLTIQNDAAATTVNDNTVTANLQIQNNAAATTVNGNIVTGNLQDQNNAGPTQIFGNLVGNNLQCQQNSSITGGGNTAGQKQGQCTAF
jgi:hypothetical protein